MSIKRRLLYIVLALITILAHGCIDEINTPINQQATWYSIDECNNTCTENISSMVIHFNNYTINTTNKD